MVYMKKRKLYDEAQAIFRDEMPKMKETDYTYKKGHEWLNWTFSNGDKGKVTSAAAYVRVERYVPWEGNLYMLSDEWFRNKDWDERSLVKKNTLSEGKEDCS